MSASLFSLLFCFALSGAAVFLKGRQLLPEAVRKSPVRLAACIVGLGLAISYGGAKPTPPDPPKPPPGPWQHVEVPTKREQAKDGLRLWPSGKLDTRHAEGGR